MGNDNLVWIASNEQLTGNEHKGHTTAPAQSRIATARPPSASLSKKFDGSSSTQIFRHFLADPGTGLLEKTHLRVVPKTGGNNKLNLLTFRVTVGAIQQKTNTTYHPKDQRFRYIGQCRRPSLCLRGVSERR